MTTELKRKDHVEKLTYSLSLDVPFETNEQALIACRTLSPDLTLNTNDIEAKCVPVGKKFTCEVKGTSDRVIRVAISSIIDSLKTIVECMDEFS